MMSASNVVRIVEVGPRDGLQNEPAPIPIAAKVRFIDQLSLAGFPVIEATSFVNPKAVPQLADAVEVMHSILRTPGVRYLTLVPNERGFERALDAEVDAIALFTAATEAFAQANVGTSIDGTFARFAPVLEQARDADMWVRGYVSVAFGCPYAGVVDPDAVASVAERLWEAGCDEVAIADTIGSAEPDQVATVTARVAEVVPMEHLAMHFHDTNGRALANVDAALAGGIRIFDSSAGGLGGCPFAPGAPGNLASEALVAHLEQLGYETGIDRDLLASAVEDIRLALAVARTEGA